MVTDRDERAGARGQYPTAFEPVRIASVEVRNRIFVPAHTTNFGRDHLPTDQHVAYHAVGPAAGLG